MNSSAEHKKLVIMTSRFPFPLEKGDKLRAFYHIKELSKQYQVYLLSTNQYKVSTEQIKQLQPYCNEIHVFPLNGLQKALGILFAYFTKLPFQVGYFHNAFIQQKINHILKRIQPDHIFCQLIRSSEYVKNYHLCPKTIDYMDALSKGIERRANMAKGLKKMLFLNEYKRLLHYENSIFEYFEHHTIISKQDQQLIFHKNRAKIHVIPNGVDDSYLNTKSVLQKDVNIVFIGNMSYAPNIKAAQFLVKEIVPLLPSTFTLRIAGASPTIEVQNLASDRVEVTGYIEDIKKAYQTANIFVAPMFIGTGLQNKLLESMALGVPCITTTLANNALHADPENEILIANSAEEFAQQIVRLIKDKSLLETIAKNAKKFIKKNYRWEEVTERLIDVMEMKI